MPLPLLFSGSTHINSKSLKQCCTITQPFLKMALQIFVERGACTIMLKRRFLCHVVGTSIATVITYNFDFS